jgi:ribonuclease HI
MNALSMVSTSSAPLKYGSSFDTSSTDSGPTGIKKLLYEGLVGTDSKKKDPLKCTDGKGSRLYIDQIQSSVDIQENSEKVSDFKTLESISKKRQLDFENEVEDAAQRMESNWVDKEALQRACDLAEEKGSALNIVVNADGGSRGNPGLSASASSAKIKVQSWQENGSVEEKEFPLFKRSRFIGLSQTNNVAEYRAFVLSCLTLQDVFTREMEVNEFKTKWKELTDQKRVRVSMFMDSQLVVRQMLGEYAVSSATMIIENASARRAFDHLCSVLGDSRDNVSLEHVKRAKNSEPDVLCNKLMNEIEMKFPSIVQERKKAKITGSK